MTRRQKITMKTAMIVMTAAEALKDMSLGIANTALPEDHKILPPERMNRKQALEWAKENMDEFAHDIVKGYVEHNLPGDDAPEFDVYIVWKAKVLQNWKYLLSTTLEDGMYYELTFNGCKGEWYLDAYEKKENVVVAIAEDEDDGE